MPVFLRTLVLYMTTSLLDLHSTLKTVHQLHFTCSVCVQLRSLMYSNCFIGPDGQLPKEKLSQLKQVLTSPFFNSVKEVYEHVYSTVDADSNSSPELRATATAKVCSDHCPYREPLSVVKCVCVCVRACVRACVRVCCTYVCVYMHVCMGVSICLSITWSTRFTHFCLPGL